MDIVADALNRIMNAKRAGKSSCTVLASKLLIEVLKIMHKHGYVDYKVENTNRITVELRKLNKCKAITPRFYVRQGELDRYARRFLPSRDIGMLIISTSKGLLTHAGAAEKRTGGSLIAYCY